MNLGFSTITISQLYRLSQAVANKTGRRYQIADESELLSLMSYCDHSKDVVINRQYRAFKQSIEQQSLSKLNKKKIRVVVNNSITDSD